MSKYAIHSIDSAPEQSKAALQELKKTFGFLPNLAAAMASSPTMIGAFVPLFQKVHAGTFSESQIQVLLLTNAVTNRSDWPVAFHSTLALKAGVSAADVDAIRAGKSPTDRAASALWSLATAMIERRGRVASRELQAFREAGFTEGQVLELITVSAASTMTNYAASVIRPSLEAMFEAQAWSAPAGDQ